jgi:multidrug efflux pump subunit AcrA (membrane-fusion protein)
VKITVLSPPVAVKSGMLARVRFQVDSRENALSVPNGAVVTETGVDYVYAVMSGVVKKLPVDTGISDDAVTEIIGGITEGTLVVTEGQSFLNDGERVTVAQ